MPDFAWISALDPRVGIVVILIMGVSFAIIVWLRLNYHIKKIEEDRKELNAAITQTEVNKTDIEWLRVIFKVKKKSE